MGFSALNYRVLLVFAKNIDLGKGGEKKAESQFEYFKIERNKCF
jgi:hypothetical protein